METKTSAFNCRSSSSIPHSNASLTSPLVNQAEHNEENHLHDNGNGNRESEDIGFSQDDDDNNNDADVKYVDNEECGGAGNGRPIVGDEDDNVVDSNFVEEAARTKELRRKALLAESNLLKFIHFKCDGRNKNGANNMEVASLSTTTRKKNSGDCENRLKDDANETIYYIKEQTMCVVSKGKEKHDDGSISKAYECENVAGGQMM
ncbi:hypothetical protein V6N11_077223 [Hibiscus sabdariffa]|uniref:Uncharacterized protein n=1 Tax=Hibiscus sabdariffa TaxID=183260 RepID=A0ABR2TCF8_9ROSI